MSAVGIYYSILGVPEDADTAQIKSAYRKLSFRYHPDVAGDNPEAHVRFIRLSRAYGILADETKRKKYDSYIRKSSVERNARTQLPGHGTAIIEYINYILWEISGTIFLTSGGGLTSLSDQYPGWIYLKPSGIRMSGL